MKWIGIIVGYVIRTYWNNIEDFCREIAKAVKSAWEFFEGLAGATYRIWNKNGKWLVYYGIWVSS